MAPAFRGSLDQGVYNIVRKLEDSNPPTSLTIASVYDNIKTSNSSLARQKKRPLEESIERVLSIRKQEQVAGSSQESDDEIPVPPSESSATHPKNSSRRVRKRFRLTSLLIAKQNTC